ncbi:translation initiation factor IF-2 isoform X1 [Bacillus rossius redtenbacheri]|uniref:translation initiation factor IF-2 isoform X1 n=1 Tax=Bacillus rossius redtenbacheri TaxID=93214 RepID=UPI002FDD8AB3
MKPGVGRMTRDEYVKLKKRKEEKKRLKQERLAKRAKAEGEREAEEDGGSSATTSETRTLSIAVPGSILENAQSAELRTYLAGQIARAACIFEVDEVERRAGDRVRRPARHGRRPEGGGGRAGVRRADRETVLRAAGAGAAVPRVPAVPQEELLPRAQGPGVRGAPQPSGRAPPPATGRRLRLQGGHSHQPRRQSRPQLRERGAAQRSVGQEGTRPRSASDGEAPARQELQEAAWGGGGTLGAARGHGRVLGLHGAHRAGAERRVLPGALPRGLRRDVGHLGPGRERARTGRGELVAAPARPGRVRGPAGAGGGLGERRQADRGRPGAAVRPLPQHVSRPGLPDHTHRGGCPRKPRRPQTQVLSLRAEGQLQTYCKKLSIKTYLCIFIASGASSSGWY